MPSPDTRAWRTQQDEQLVMRLYATVSNPNESLANRLDALDSLDGRRLTEHEKTSREIYRQVLAKDLVSAGPVVVRGQRFAAHLDADRKLTIKKALA